MGPWERRKAEGLDMKAQWGFLNGSKAARGNKKECAQREEAERLRKSNISRTIASLGRKMRQGKPRRELSHFTHVSMSLMKNVLFT